MIIACDYNGALLRALIYSQQSNTGISHFDLIWAIYDLRKEILITIVTQQVKSHLDTKEPGRKLNRWEILNCEADQGAKEIMF